jgi:hypothetical protein
MAQFQRIGDKKEWRDLLGKALFKTFFHSLEWEDFLEKNFKWLKFEHYLYKDEILLSLARYKIFGREKLISHPFCEYGGPLPLKQGISGREFKNNLFSSFRNPLKISLHPEISRYFNESGLKEPDSSRDAYFIENISQKSEDEIFSSFRKTLRHSLRIADRNIEIEKCKDKKDLRDFYNLYLKTVRRHKTIAYPYSFFEYFFNNTNNKAEIVLAKLKDKIIAGSIFLFYDKYIHYFLNASDGKYKDLRANYLILWNQIKNYLGTGYEVFDFGGTGRGSSLEVFKSGWGAKRYPIFEIKNFSENKLRESRLRNILGIFPSFILEKLSQELLRFKL